MSFKRLAHLGILALAILAVLFGCDLLGMSIQARLAKFAADLSRAQGAARADTYLNFHKDLTQDYAAIAGLMPGTGEYIWDTYFPQPATPGAYTITIVDESDPANVTATVGSTAGTGVWPKDAKFQMAKDGFDYQIVSMWLDVDGDHSFQPAEQIIK